MTTDPKASQEKIRDTAAEEYQIPEAEKLAAQWEARHDLAAGRRSADPMHVQHYLAHLRSEQALHEGEHQGGVVRRVAPKPRTPRRAEPAPVPARHDDDHGWRRWFHHTDHRNDH